MDASASTPAAAAEQAKAENGAIRPFSVEIPEEKLDDLRRRIAATRWPEKELVNDHSQGVQSAMMQALTRYWATDYDWRKCEAELNALPQFKTEIDGLDIHFIHVKSPHENALPLIITHGWPGSVIEMLEVIGPLTDPTAHGGRAEDAFHLVVPSLPGFGFSDQPTELGWDQTRTAKAWGELMNRLGYTRYVAQGGDQGAPVTDAMARIAPDGLGRHPLQLPQRLPDRRAGGGLRRRPRAGPVPAACGCQPRGPRREEGSRGTRSGVEAFKRGYIVEMPEHPQTIGFGLTDSPVGLAAWMLDHDADSYEKISRAFVDGKPTGGLTRDSVLDNITLYWLTNTATSAARIYWEEGRATAAAVAAGKKPPKLESRWASLSSRARSSRRRATGPRRSIPT